MKLKLIFFWLSLLMSLSQQARNSRAILTDPPPPADAKNFYGRDTNQFGELRLPNGDKFLKPYPVVVVLHGGCWMAEYGLGYMGHVSADLTDYGFVTWNLEYRRIGNAGGGWPTTLEDATAGVQHLKELAKKYPLDLQRVIVIGHSAGGHLALLSAKQQFTGFSLRGIVSLGGITDLRRTGTACDGNVLMLMNGKPEDKAAAYDFASPIKRLPLGVRQVIVQGKADSIIPTEMATSYVTAAQAKGDDVELVLLEKAGHFEVIDPQAAGWPMIREAILRVGQK